MCVNYRNPEGVFPLYALREPVNEYSPRVQDVSDKLRGLVEEFNKGLYWHTISSEPGLYDGLQLYVKCDWPEYEVLDDVWGCFLGGLSSVPDKCGYAPYPSFESPCFNNAQLILCSDNSSSTQEQLDEAYELVRLDVSKRYQAEIDTILERLEIAADYCGLTEIIANGKTPIWA